MTRKQEDELLSATTITSFVNLHYIEQLKATRFYRANIKKFGKPFLNALVKVEKQMYDLLCESDPEEKFVKPVTDSFLEWVEIASKKDFGGFLDMQTLTLASDIDRKRMLSIANKIIKENNKLNT